MLAPLEAGVLTGCATAPREMLPLLRQTAPHVDWQEKRWHQEGKVWTSGAVSLLHVELLAVESHFLIPKITRLIFPTVVERPGLDACLHGDTLGRTRDLG